jgi:hypothetical protein
MALKNVIQVGGQSFKISRRLCMWSWKWKVVSIYRMDETREEGRVYYMRDNINVIK